jgi:hypothetical protein
MSMHALCAARSTTLSPHARVTRPCCTSATVGLAPPSLGQPLLPSPSHRPPGPRSYLAGKLDPALAKFTQATGVTLPLTKVRAAGRRGGRCVCVGGGAGG